MTSLAYLLEANLSLLVFIGFYHLVLRRLTFFEWNRFYLLSGLIASLVIPFLPLAIPSWRPAESATMTYWVSQVATLPQVPADTFLPKKGLSWVNLLKLVYWIGVAYGMGKLVLDIRAALRLAKNEPSQRIGPLHIVWVASSLPASSFFHYVFLPGNGLQDEALAVTLRHEQVHVQQWHSLDKLLARLGSALFWFNPMMHHWQQAIAVNHEYLADAATVKAYDPVRYCHLLVSRASRPGLNSTLHYFSSSQLKLRIVMIHQLRSTAVQRLRFLLVAPLLGVLLFLISCEQLATEDLIHPSWLPKDAYLFKELVGSWTNTDRTTINANDGHTPRDFPERGGEVTACLSRLVLGADGRFQMSDERTRQILRGTWESDQAGVSVQLHLLEKPSPSGLYYRDGSLATGPFTKTILLDVISLKSGAFEAWQAYGADDQLSAGQVYYQYRRE